MRRFVFSLVILIGIYMPQSKTKVVFFGDSITEMGAMKGGYIRKVDSLCNTERKSDQFEFVGAGIGGNKVYDLYLRMEEDVLDKHPNVVVIFIGVNDVWHKFSRGTGTDADKFEKFYQAIIRKLKDQNIRTILCTPAVIGEKTDNTNQQDGDMNAYSEIIRQLVTKNNLELIDLRKAFLDYNLKNNIENKESGILTTDGVHLNAKGNEFVASQMWKVISRR